MIRASTGLLAVASLFMTVQAGGQGMPGVPLQPVPGQLRNAQAIAGFLAKLGSARASSPPLSIVQIGDSHTAGDAITNGWRSAWQAEYGAGGRGMSAVGRPYQGYLTWGVTARQSPDWVTNALFGKERVANGPALGLSGFTLSTQHAGAWVQLSADSYGFRFDRFALCGLTGPDKGAVRIMMDGATPGEYSFARDEAGATCFNVAAPVPVEEVSITTLDDRPVNLTSWSSSHKAGGVMLSSLGVVGARFGHFTRNDDAVLGVELRQARPDLLVIAFGTNEGFDPTLKPDEAEYVMRTQIERLRRLLGRDVPILLIGPPDANSNRPEVALPGRADTVSCGNGWYTPGNLAQVRQMQIHLAQAMNLAFWDWQGAMGGRCSSPGWVAQGLQRADHVHFTVEGGRRLGGALAADLDRARADLAQ